MSNPPGSQGYVMDTGYAETFFRELSPVWLNYVAALNGGRPLQLDRPFTYLELGCGFATSTVVNAGAFPQGEFHACDFNPMHVEGGERHAAALGITNIQFHQRAFQELLATDLPAFDFIVLHGVYSWVGAEARHAIRHVIHEKLKPGGLVYVSYNCLPGWSTEAPLRKLLLELAATASGDSAERMQHALHSLKELSGNKLRYFQANPAAVAAVDTYIKGSGNYLVHEFLNESWELFYSIDVADEMTQAGLSYLGSATLADNHHALLVDGATAEVIAKLATVRQRQLAIDFATHQRFRRDVFVRGHESLRQAELSQQLGTIVIGCPNPERIGTRVKVPRGEITLQENFVRELQQLMVHGSMTMSDAVTALSGKGRDALEIARNLLFLVAAGTLQPFAKARKHDQALEPQRLADAMTERALTHAVQQRARSVIPSEIMGNGVQIRPIEALAIMEFVAGATDIESLAKRLKMRISSQPDAAVTDHAHAVAKEVVENLVPNLARLGLMI